MASMWMLVMLLFNNCVYVTQGHSNEEHTFHKRGFFKMHAEDMSVGNDDVMESYKANTLADCATNCTSTDTCFSFSFNTKTHICQLTEQWYKEYFSTPMISEIGTLVYSGM